MRVAAAMCAYAVLMSLLAGCGGNPAAPTAVTMPSSTSRNPSSGLSITEFNLQGWHDELFHYLPAVSVSIPPTGGTVYVQRVDFTTSKSGATARLAGIGFGNPQRVVSPGGILDLFEGLPPVEIISPDALSSITATVSFTNGVDSTGTVALTQDGPTLPANASSAVLVIQAFSVVGSSDRGTFSYWPKLTLAETAGVSRAVIRKMTFQLVGVGPAGRVPEVWEQHEVPACGTLTLDDDGYGGPWLGITSTADASQVSVAISFVDDRGRGGSITAATPVSR